MENESAVNKPVFSNFIRTDGHTADVVLYKKIRKSLDEYNFCCSKEIIIEDVGKEVVPEEFEDYSLCAIDPGRTHIYTASYGHQEDMREIRRFSSKEYYALTGSNRIAKQEIQRMEQENVSNIFLNMPTTKTASLSTYYTYVHYIFLSYRSNFFFQ
jgi:hypothetical protein